MFSKKHVTWLLILVPLVAWAAATTLNSSGNWDDTGIWDSGNIADMLSEDVDFDNNIGTVTVRAGFSYTVNNIAMNNGNTLTIASTGTLNVGNTGTGFTLSTGNTAVINVDGDLTIWGDLDVGNTLTLNVTGNLVIKGDLVMGNDGTLDVQGNVQIDGSLTGGNNADVNVDGTLTATGGITVGNGSTLSGSGTVNEGTGCTGPPTFCSSGPLPITLGYFEAEPDGSFIQLKWRTLTEENFEYFSVQRSGDLVEFEEIARLEGAGDSKDPIDYSFEDRNPVPGTSYYRLQSFDFDGYTEIFDAVSVFFEPQNNFEIYPSLLTGMFVNVRYQSSELSTGRPVVKLIDLSGGTKFSTPLPEDLSVVIPSSIPNGIYFIEMITDTNINRSRIIIAR